MSLILRSLLVLTALGFPIGSALAETPTHMITIKNHKFSPAELTLPAGKKVKLVIKNQDPTPEEFESYSLHREKIVGGNSQIIVFVGPLKPGVYDYFGEFNPKTAQGKIIVK